MYKFFLLSLATVGFLTVRYAVKKFVAKRAYVRAMRLNGCQPVRKWPHKDPIFGLFRFRRVTKAQRDGNASEAARQDFETHGKTYQSYIMGRTTIHTMDWANIHTVQSLEFEKWGVHPSRKGVAILMGNGITVSDGPTWSHARKTLRPVFQKSQFKDLEERAFEKHFSRMLKRIPKDDSTVDLQKLFKKMFINISLEYIFGETRFSELDDSSPEADAFVADYSNAVRIIAKIQQGMRLPFDISGHKKALKKATDNLRSYVDNQIAAAFEKKNKAVEARDRKPASDEGYVFVGQLAYETEDRNFIRDQLLNIFFLARDASSAGASFIFFILARHPNVWTKLRSEVLSLEQPLRSRYLRQVIDECLRLLAPSNRAIRTCIKDCVLPFGGGPDGRSPVYVTAGTHIDLSFGQMHKDRTTWGEDVNDFRLERWDNPGLMNKYQPFFAGPRRCPAQQMLVTQYSYVLVRMAKLFQRIDNKDPILKFVEEHNMTITSRNGVQVALIPATE